LTHGKEIWKLKAQSTKKLSDFYMMSFGPNPSILQLFPLLAGAQGRNAGGKSALNPKLQGA
jgi:hypothetical protein